MPARCSYQNSTTQTGAALAVALVMLLAITLLGVAAIGGNQLQTRMAHGLSESARAFQSAESALSVGEAWLENQIAQPIASCVSNCKASLSIWDKATTPITTANLLSDTWWANNGRPYNWTFVSGSTPAVNTSQTLPDLAAQPLYSVQQLGKDPSSSLVQGQGKTYEIWYYEIDAKGTGALADTTTTVQSVYAKGY